jgi:hypothetical protein
MKKHVKKLSLSRETLRTLAGDLHGVMGGGGVTIDTSCACDNATGCECATNFCLPATACLGSCSCSR